MDENTNAMIFFLVSALVSLHITLAGAGFSYPEDPDPGVHFRLIEPLTSDDLNPVECGMVKNVRRITGGKEAQLSQFPWMARLAYQSESGIKFSCGGSLLNQHYVLTAAHCLYGWEDNLKFVRLGENYADTEEDCEGNVCAPPVQDIPVEEIHIHSGYNHSSAKNDIAIIRLMSAAEYNDGVKPICLPIKRFEKKKFISQSMETAGWGIMDSSKEITAQRLLYVTIPIRDRCACQMAMPSMQLDETQFCAGLEMGEDSCSGDSGGPLMKTEYVGGNKRYYVFGLVSFGKSYCGEAPSVYTNVIPYLRWIQFTVYGTEMSARTPNTIAEIAGARDNWYRSPRSLDNK